MEKEQKHQENFKHIVRIANTDINGNKKVVNGLRKIKGLSFMMINAVCQVAGVDPYAQIGTLSDEQLKKIDDSIRSPARYGIPSWLFNRRKDYESGEDMHLIGNDLKYVQENDIKRLRMIKTYRGQRLPLGLTVRGQRTKSHFRKNKGKVVGVIKSKAAKAAVAEKEKK
ncbi:MAG: 30S ribosomal protein S13 [Candidatus Woesearchaeota archaeon]